MKDVAFTSIPKAVVYQAAQLARLCSTESVQERVLISQSAALSIRKRIETSTGLRTEDGRSNGLNYVELLDICDFTINGWHAEVRTITQNTERALYVPTMPLMVGVLSDFYLCAVVDVALTGVEVIGYIERDELKSAELSANGLFAVLPVDVLRPFEQLLDLLKTDRKRSENELRVFSEWQMRADRIVRGLSVLLESEDSFEPEQITRLIAGLHDDLLRIGGKRLPLSGLEPLFDSLFQRFGVEEPVPAAPGSPVVFSNRAEEKSLAGDERTRDRFFRNELTVRQRVSLYRDLLEKDAVFEEHRQMKRLLDRATAGAHGASPNRRATVQKIKEKQAERAWVEPPMRQAVNSTNDMSETNIASRDENARATARITRLEDLTPNAAVRGILPDNLVTVINAKWHGSDVVELTYKDSAGHLGNELLYRDRELTLEIASTGRPWSFDAEGDLLRLVSEAHRIRLAYLFDPLLAVHTSLVEPLPHQITAVYGEMLQRQPLRFLLADDPGAGKTIMAGLLIKELLIRGDLRRCLIVCPGGLVEQWQDELSRKFGLPFEIMTNDKLESARTGNWFKENSLAICRLDKLSRNESVQAKLEDTDWDLIVCDEAHKMSASFFGGEVNYTKRYRLGQLLSGLTRHFLLMTATPHNGKEADFQLFMALLDGDRFEGKFRDGVHSQDTSDLMRRLVKEQLLKFDGTPLFPESTLR